MGVHDDTSSRISKVSKSFQQTLNNRLDKMNFKDQTGEIYDDPDAMHPEKTVYFVQRDEDTIELWKGDIQISGQGGDWKVVNALLLESSAVSAITGGANGTIFMTGGDHNDTLLDTPSYNQIAGQFTLTTRGRQEGANWVTQNTPTGNFAILHNYQLCLFVGLGSSTRNGTSPGPKYVIELLRSGVRETIIIRPFILSHHVSVPIYHNGSVAAYKYSESYEDALVQAYYTNGHFMDAYPGYYVTRSIHNGATTHGYYYSGGGDLSPGNYSTRNAYPTSMPSIAVTQMFYWPAYDAICGNFLYLNEYPRSQNRFGQLGILYDLETGDRLTTPQVIFNVDHPSKYANEFIMYKILKGESIT